MQSNVYKFSNRTSLMHTLMDFRISNYCNSTSRAETPVFEKRWQVHQLGWDTVYEKRWPFNERKSQ